LHGLEIYIKSTNPKLGVVRYADDFIVTAGDKGSLEVAQIQIQQWLSERGLELSVEYYKGVVSKETFEYVKSRTWKYLWQWAKRRHPNKNTKWVRKRYFKTINGSKWTFATTTSDRRGIKKDLILYPIAYTPIERRGLNDIENLQHLHTACHKQVHSKSKFSSLK
jgi:hypothetical protein